MAEQPLPKLPKLAKLSGLQALLLLGGAFVFSALAWGFNRYEIVADRTPAAPEGAVFAATLLDRTGQDWPAFEAALPEEARKALAVADGPESVTLFAVPQGKELQWWTVEAMSAVTERTSRKAYRLVPKGTDAVGHVMFEGRSVPFEANFSGGTVRARVGRRFRGPKFQAEPFTDVRRLVAPLHQQLAYAEKPAAASWSTVSGLLTSEMQRFQALGSFWNLSGRVELAVSASATPGLQPFIVYHRPTPGTETDRATFEDAAKLLLAEAEPIGFDVTLPDDSSMTEFRRDPSSVLTTRKDVRGFGTRAQLKAPGGTQQMEIFYADTGETWLSNDLGLIQTAYAGNVGAVASNEACERSGPGGFLAFSGQNPALPSYFQGFERLTFSLEETESGLFTFCGYFIH